MIIDHETDNEFLSQTVNEPQIDSEISVQSVNKPQVDKPQVDKPQKLIVSEEKPSIKDIQPDIKDTVATNPIGKQEPNYSQEFEAINSSTENSQGSEEINSNYCASENLIVDTTEKLSQEWETFVEFIGKTANKSLVSLLRSSVVLEKNDRRLIIGYQNIKLYSEEKRKKIEQFAQDFFKYKIEVHFQERKDGIDDSLRKKLEEERKKQVVDTKKAAMDSKEISDILSIFPNSQITRVEIIEE